MVGLLCIGLALVLVIFLSRSGKVSDTKFFAESLTRLTDEIRDLRKEVRSTGAGKGQSTATPADVESLSADIRALRYEIMALKDMVARPGTAPAEAYKTPEPDTRPLPEPELIVEIIEPTEPEPVVPEPIPEPEPEQEKPAEEVAALLPDNAIEVPLPLFAPRQAAAYAAGDATPPQPPPAPYVPLETWSDKFARNNPDLEKFIGENLINKIGIAILVLGIAFFVKYAIDQNWINEYGRVAIGMGCGAILIGLAHYLRNSYRSFSSVLAGGGIAVFYFTIAFAFHQYHIIPQTAAFVIMVLITAFAIALSVLYDKLELAIIAAIGGFITPFLVSTGDGNYVVLFSYLIILNLGLLSLAWFKRWPSLNIIALFFTEIIYAGWLGDAISHSKPFSCPAALAFATAFYLIFLGMNMINQVRNKVAFRPFDFFVLLLITFSYYSAGMVVLHQWNHGAYQGLFTLFAGVVNLGIGYYVYKNGNADRNLLFLLIGLTLTFITLTIPIQLHGHAITMFWSAEFVLLYWLAGVSGIKLFRYSSLLLCGLTLMSLFMDWNNASASVGLNIIYRDITGLSTNLVAIAAFALYYYLLRKEKGSEFITGVPATGASYVALFVSVVLLYVTCMFGVNLYFRQLLSYEIPNVYHRMITLVFGLALLMLARRREDKVTPWWQLLPFVVCFFMYLVSLSDIYTLRNGVPEGRYAWGHMAGHITDMVLLVILLVATIQSIRRNMPVFAAHQRALGVFITIAAILLLSIELENAYIILFFKKGNQLDLEQQFNKAGLTVLWGLCSFVLMWLGMKHRQKTLRIFSLTLFAIVLLKLFVVDITEISKGGKILVFILLGVLLLIVSFMYQKLKKLIIDDKTE